MLAAIEGMCAMRMPPFVFAVALTGLLAACAHHRASSVPPTPAARATASAPVLTSGYKKVAAPAGAAVYFVNLKNGDVVTSPVLIQFGLRGVGVAPAGIEKEATGHHHLLIDVPEIDLNAPIPATDTHRHFGGGQTEVRVELKPGVHTLQLLLADHNHIPHHPAILSERITVTVK
jgi:hypothetical protein